MDIGLCKLCLNEKELLNKSHIIPDFMYKTLYDDKHRIIRFIPLKIKGKPQSFKYIQNGVYEGGILCEKCDNEIIQKYETYACKILFSKDKLAADIKLICQNYINKDGLQYTVCTNLDYTKFKLFLLSILWRASISKNKMFNEIDLEENEEIIREMVLTGNPKSENDFPISIFSFFKDKEASNDFVIQPRKAGTRYLFPMRGIIFNFYLDFGDVKTDFRNNILKEQGSMTLIHFKNGNFNVFLDKYFR